MRQAASPDADTAQEAVSELHGSIFHQGTVYPATVAAVPFLAELATAAPHGRADLVWMLGMLADPHHAYGDEVLDVRAAVAAQLPVLQTLLADGDQNVREAAAYTAAQAGTDAESLRKRWRTETAEPVRASLALALGLIDPAATGPELTDLVLGAAPPVRVAAAVALLRAGLPWPDGAVTAVVAAIDDGAIVEYCWAHGGEWSAELVVATSAPVARELLDQLLKADKPKTRELGLYAASERCDVSRSAPPQLVPLVAAAVNDPDPDVRQGAVSALSRAGAAAGRYADLLAGLAAGFPDVAGARGFTSEYQAVNALARLGDPRWIDPVCAAAAAGHRTPWSVRGARLEPAVLAAVRQRLADEPARADVLAFVLGTWRAPEAVPELLAALPHEGPEAAGALLAIGHDDPAAVPHLRARVTRTGDPAAALAVRRITGDARPLLDLLDTVLSGKGELPRGPQTFVDGLGETLYPLLPAAREQLTGAAARTHPQREVQILAARIVAAVDGVPPVLATVRAVLAGGWGPAASTAAGLIADLAPDHRDTLAALEPLLRGRLGDRLSRVSAARALARLGVPVTELTEPLVHGVADHAGLATILELRAVETIPGLVELTARDSRIHLGGGDDAMWNDELLVERIHTTIAALRAG
ncbi:hypothetical protein GCM10009779_08100 [Polymorphospora rubra]|uniref:HEAT repeat protein n=1 Tax=Polymorphospora rubra TaxID=338584 RepID=A0A810N7Z6_9ACTN|nr:hypothetical protein Prubr_67530 [Polymorphospora rubra]